ncbi:MAG: hypothetical protein ACTSX1_12465 [Candidatus Heimdallarchaeaceae archaeon]
MKALEFNVLRMIILMTQEYSFCEAFEQEGFSPDVSKLRNAYDAGDGKINHRAEMALKRVYKKHIAEGFEAEIIEYNAIVLPPTVEFNDTLKIAQIVESAMPKGVVKILAGREDYRDATDNNDKLYGTDAIETAIIECEVGTEPDAAQEDKDYLEALNNKMGVNEISYIQLIK